MKLQRMNYLNVWCAILAVLVCAPLHSKPLETAQFVYSKLSGIGVEQGVMRRDPSDVIKVGELYYVWYSKGPKSGGYDATIWYATSADGHDWTEQGMALGKGTIDGNWDEASVFTPNILVAEGKYWLFFSGISKKPIRRPDTKIGVAVSDSPDGPWERVGEDPILQGSDNPEDFDSHLIDDACLIVRDGKYWFYFKGRQIGKTASQTNTGVAFADKPAGPYTKYEGNPVLTGVHEVLVWPQGEGVAALVGGIATHERSNSIVYSEDGLNFTRLYPAKNVPHAAGAYRPEAFTGSVDGELVEWGVHIGKYGRKNLPYIERFDIRLER